MQTGKLPLLPLKPDYIRDLCETAEAEKLKIKKLPLMPLIKHLSRTFDLK